jgi:N-acetylmuramoyl-L-alanine amidase
MTPIGRRIVWFLIAILSLGLFLAGPALALTEKFLWDNAVEARKKFMADTKAQANREKWQAVIDRYLRVVQNFPSGEKADQALLTAGDLYQQMHKRSQRSADLDNAIETYQKTARSFPNRSSGAAAQLRIGEIFLNQKKDTDRAYRELLKVELNHPKSKTEVAQARKLMARISGSNKTAGKDEPPAPPAPAKPTAASAGKPTKPGAESPAAPKVAPAKDPAEGGPIRVTRLRHWQNPSYSRVAVDLDRPVTFEGHMLRADPKLKLPMRLYLDLENAVIGPGVRDEIVIADGFLSKARLAQYDAKTVRLVLDIQHIENYRIFSLDNPFRIVIDVTGETPPAVLAGGPSTSPSEKSPTAGPPAAGAPEGPAGDGKPSGSDVPAAGEGDKEPLQDLRETALKRPKTPRGPARGGATDQASLARQLGLGIRKVVIDPGHGGKDRGTAGPSGLKEKDLTLKAARLLAEKIQKKLGLETVLTRTKDEFLTLEERTAAANTLAADLFISVHANAHPSAKVNGLETYILNIATDQEAMRVAQRENAASNKNMSDLQMILGDLMLNSKINESSVLGNHVHRAMVRGAREKTKDVRDLGVKQAPFYVLIGANMPSILVEIGFMSNKAEEKRLMSEEYLDRLTDGIVEGIRQYRDSIKKSG